MKPYLQRLWDQWGQLFIDRTRAMHEGETFRVRDALQQEWSAIVASGDNNNVGKAIKAAFIDVRYQSQLDHLQPPWVNEPGNNNQNYRRR